MSAYRLFGGGINYSQDSQKGVLVGIKPEDSPFEIKEKIKIARLIYAISPEVFISFDEKAIEELLGSLPAEEVIDLDKEFDLRTASYEELKAFVKDNGIVSKNQSKKSLIEAIEAISVDDDTDLL